MVGWCPLTLQGKMEACGSQSELLSQGVDPTHLLGLMKKNEERDEFAYEDEEEEEEERKGILFSRVWLTQTSGRTWMYVSVQCHSVKC